MRDFIATKVLEPRKDEFGRPIYAHDEASKSFQDFHRYRVQRDNQTALKEAIASIENRIAIATPEGVLVEPDYCHSTQVESVFKFLCMGRLNKEICRYALFSVDTLWIAYQATMEILAEEFPEDPNARQTRKEPNWLPKLQRMANRSEMNRFLDLIVISLFTGAPRGINFLKWDEQRLSDV